jgi:hypothetical protein
VKRAALAGALALALSGSLARADGPAAPAAPHATVDRIVARYYSPETGGSSRPRFVSERTLAFEARIEALAEQAAPSTAYEDRFVRAALDRHVAEDMLSALAVQSGSAPELSRLADQERTGLVERVGGKEALAAAMREEGIDDSELDALVRRRARSAWYVDRALTPLLRPSEEQLREVFRTAAHPFKNRTFDDARPALERWFVEERLRAAETTFLQEARARVRVVVVTRSTEAR